MPPRTREFKVGLVILAAVAVIAAGIFLIGEKNNLFSSKNRYFIDFASVSGLKPGNPVQLNGVDVGTVERVVLPEDPAKEHIRVWISVERDYAERIRGPAGPGTRPARTLPASVARIKTLGLLGDKFIEITLGAPEYPVIPSESEIPAAQPTNVDALIASGEDVMDNVVEISASLSTILARMEHGEGLLGELTSNTPSAQRLRQSLLGTSESLERIANKIETGDGPIPRLLNDREMGERLATSIDRFETLLAKAESGPGLLPGLLNDPGMKAQAEETLASLNGVARDLRNFTSDLETSDALLPRLVKDEEYGREVTEEVRQIVDRLGTISQQMASGQGSFAKLVNDPQVYEAVNDILVGVNESRLLRWLIRNRQKAGIKRRYEDTREALKAQGETPPPAEEVVVEPEEPAPGEEKDIKDVKDVNEGTDGGEEAGTPAPAPDASPPPPPTPPAPPPGS
jgi:phospholipid/cholesterol/gamma-HCH transport system substrate-binding protein